jgi:hypothetical protein
MNNIILSPIDKNELINELADVIVLRLTPVAAQPIEPEELLQTYQVMKLLGRSRTTIKNNSRVYFKRSDILNSGLHLQRKKNR